MYLHVDDEGVFDHVEDGFFTSNVVDLFQSYNLRYRHDLQGKVLFGWSVLRQNYSPECARAWKRQERKVVINIALLLIIF